MADMTETTVPAIPLSVLRDFRAKSELLVPRCFGGYDAKDPICKEYCARARVAQFANDNSDIRRKLNEEVSRDSFFANISGEACETRANALKMVFAQAQRDLTTATTNRSMRDTWLQGGHLPRIPRGTVHNIAVFRDFTKISWLEIRMDAEGGEPPYREAVGRVRDVDRRTIGQIKSIVSPASLPAGTYYINALSQQENEADNLVVTVALDRQRSDEFTPPLNLDEESGTFKIELYKKSVQITVRADDEGPLDER